MSLPNSAYITNYFDPVARVLGTLAKSSGGTTLDSALYGYNAAGQRTAFTNAATYVTYSYDPLGQLVVGTSSVSAENRGYLYDAAWNLNTLTNNGATTSFAVNSRDELTSIAGSPCTYDANGNLTQLGNLGSVGTVQFTYDDENRLTQVATNYNSAPEGPLIGQSVTNWKSVFVYDGLSRLRKRSEYGDGVLQTVTTYLYDGFRVIQERDGSNNPQVSYTRGNDLSGSFGGAGGIGGLLARSSGYSSGNWSSHAYYHADGNGNITCLLDGSQNVAATYRYDPYGNTVSSNGTLAAANVYRFSSKECHVNSGMYYYGYRFYCPNLQRCVNRDPLGEAGFEAGRGRKSNPPGVPLFAELQSRPNLYTYVENSPIADIDPLGLMPPGAGVPRYHPAPPSACAQQCYNNLLNNLRTTGKWAAGGGIYCGAIGGLSGLLGDAGSLGRAFVQGTDFGVIGAVGVGVIGTGVSGVAFVSCLAGCASAGQ